MFSRSPNTFTINYWKHSIEKLVLFKIVFKILIKVTKKGNFSLVQLLKTFRITNLFELRSTNWICSLNIKFEGCLKLTYTILMVTTTKPHTRVNNTEDCELIYCRNTFKMTWNLAVYVEWCDIKIEFNFNMIS